MCGIAGFLGHPRASEPRALLGGMVDAIAHRGPDDSGLFLADGVALGHARLSIIDVLAGQQPMADEEAALHVSFNGEIFNYIELRDDLIERGYRFRTHSDTEVILKAYQAFGPDCVERFNGDFAFALWDARRRRLMLARDRMGVRPLFYAQRPDGLFFASEVKALLQVPGIAAELDPLALDQIFTFWCALPPRTAFKDILQLPPAHLLIAECGQVTVRPYWRLEFPQDGAVPSPDRAGEDALAAELRALLTDATRIRLRSDVPVGSYLSGGLDSSIVTALAQQLAPDRLRTFSVAFEAAEFDETPFQQDMVRALGTEHSAVLCTTERIGRSFPQVVRAAEAPILRTAPAPLHVLAGLVRESGYKVVLTGEGADEVFAGYDIFKEAKIRRFCARQPGSRIRPLLLRRLYPYLPRLQGQSQPYLEAFFGAGRDRVDDPLFSHLPRMHTTAGAKIFFSGDLRAAIGGYDAADELRAMLPDGFARWHPLSRAQYIETTLLLPGYILSSQGDRMAMAHGVEGRFPFLDHRVVEFAARIPPRLKMRGLREKHILRESMAGVLPSGIANRTKQPYRAPESQSFSGRAAPSYVAERLAASEIAAAGYFNARAVAKLAEKCRREPLSGFRNNAALVGILSTQLWHDQFVRGAAERDAEPLTKSA